ncbi:MAG: bifunctional 4-hydroxy-2-oxoglutarate aldolase/2-dehydro-3-deoxy-phosphogluconate aldolase [Actinomycetota bacterium]
MNGKLFEERVGRLRDATIIAIFRVQAPAHAVEGIGAATRGGFEAVEITMNSPGATDALSEVAGHTDAILGAGTVLEASQVKEAYDAGAEFIVTPTVNLEVIEAAHGLDLPVCMGASTPTEIRAAHKGGADWVKVFPTGENYLGYLDAGAELVGFANGVFDPVLAAAGRYDELERRAVEINRRLDLYLTEASESE